MAESSSVPMDVVKVESEGNEAVTAKTPLGLEGTEAKAREIAEAGDRDRAEALIQKVTFMESCAKSLTDRWVWHEPALNQEKEKLERQLKSQAKQMSCKTFLMELGEASNAAEPQNEKGVPNANNVTQLALAHSVVAGILTNKEEFQDVQSGRLSIRYGQLRERLETFVAGGKFTTEPDTRTSTAQVKEQAPAAGTKRSAEKAGMGNKVDENLGSLETQEEKDLVRDIHTALANHQAAGFLHKRLEYGGHIRVPREGYQNFGLQNLDDKTAEVLRDKLNHNFPHEDYGDNAIHSGGSRLRLVTDPDKLPDPSQDKKAAHIRVGKDNVVLELGYRVSESDSLNRNGDFLMYLIVPRALGERIYASCEKNQQDDPARAVKVLGHALGEDLDINWRDDKTGQDKYAKLDVQRVRLERY